MNKWSIRKWKCRCNYQDGCRPVWMVWSPNAYDLDEIATEFDTWAEAMTFVNREMVA